MKGVIEVQFFKYLACLLVSLFLVACQTQSVKNDAVTIGQHHESPADLYVSLGVEYMRLGMNDVALEKLSTAIQIDPNASDAHNVLAVLYDTLGEQSLAEKHYLKAVRLQPSNSGAQNNYARFLCQSGQYEQADRHFLLAVKNPLYKSTFKALTNAGVCAMANHDIKKAEAYFLQVLRKDKRYPLALLQMANLRFEQKRYLSVRAYLQRFRSVQKHTAASLWLGIQAEKKLNNSDVVASYSQELAEFFPDSYEADLLTRGGMHSFRHK